MRLLVALRLYTLGLGYTWRQAWWRAERIMKDRP